VIPNKFVEANGAAREVLEKGFRFTPRNLGIFAVFGIAVPVIIYKGCVNEFVRAQEIGFPSFFPSPAVSRRGDDERFERFSSRAAYTRKRTDRVPSRRPGTEQRYTDKKYGRPEKKFM
jgi:hypothetical protein